MSNVIPPFLTGAAPASSSRHTHSNPTAHEDGDAAQAARHFGPEPDAGAAAGFADADAAETAPDAAIGITADTAAAGASGSSEAASAGAADEAAAESVAEPSIPSETVAEPAMHARPRSRYIPALDGLRTLAVAVVVLYHLNPTLMPGGMQGVTIFFVLSGYLITHLLLVEFGGTRTIDLKGFWVRRMRRLMPAMLSVVVATTALCTIFNHVMLTKMRPDIVPSVLFVNNWWQILHDVSYFNNIGDPSPLTHFWSLAIEAQFYLVWPPVLLFCLKRRVSRRHIRYGVAILAGISALAMALLYNPAVDPSRIYYGTDTRAFSLLMGAWLALVPARSLSPRAVRERLGGMTAAIRARQGNDTQVTLPAAIRTAPLDVLGIVGLLGTLALCLWSNGYSAFPYRGGILLASLAGVMLVAACARPESRLAHLFAAKPLVWIGQRSYSIYLWHYPLLLLMNPAASVSDRPWWLLALQVCLVVAVSAVSYRLIETPCRHGAMGALVHRVRFERETLPAWGKRHAVELACSVAVLAVAIGGLVVVPPTSALSDEGAALLQDEGASNATDGAPAPEGEDNSVAGTYDITMIGDSVSLRAVEPFRQTFAHGTIDAAKSRQFVAGIEVYRGMVDQGLAGRVAVFALGTNGAVTDANIDELMGIVGEKRIAVFVNNRCPQPWIAANNQVFSSAAERYDNVRVVDWFGYSANRDELFDGDGTHLSAAGSQKYVQLIAQAVQPYLPPHFEEGNDPTLAAAQRATDALRSAVGKQLASSVATSDATAAQEPSAPEA